MKNVLEKMRTTNECVVVFLVNAHGETLMGNRVYKNESEPRSIWTSPGGRCNDGETLLHALYRETQEEVGITKLQVESYLGTVKGAQATDTVYVFVCSTVEDFVNNEPEKFKEWRWVSYEEYTQDTKYSGFSPHVRALVARYIKNSC